MSADKLPESVRTTCANWYLAEVESIKNPCVETERAANKANDAFELAMLAALRERERETIERCAVVCLSVGANEPDNRVAEVCADKIRALLPPEEKPS